MSAPFWIVLAAVLGVAVAAVAAFASGRATLGAVDPAGRAPAHPVLLPERPSAEDVARVRLATTVPGYQRDQVDAVLVRLQDALADRDARIAELERASAPRGTSDVTPESAPEAAFGEAAPDPR